MTLLSEKILSNLTESNESILPNYHVKFNDSILGRVAQVNSNHGQVGLSFAPLCFYGLVAGRNPIQFAKTTALLQNYADQNTTSSGRYINPTTKDYEFDTTTGSLKGQSYSQQQLYLAIATLKDSSSISGFGLTAPKNGMIPGSQQKVQQDIKAAIKHINIIIDSIVVNRNQTRLEVVIKYRDSINAQQQTFQA